MQGNVRVAVLLVLGVLCALLPIAYAGTCEFVENDFYTYDEVLQCFHSIPLSPEVKTQTLETLRRSLEIYAFYDIAHNSPSPQLPLHVNMQQGLQEIYDRPYYYDFDFQQDLRSLYIALRDAHTQYYAPTCYQNILIRQGFGPIAFGNDTENFNITVSQYYPIDLVDYYQQEYSINIMDYYFDQIVAINGIPAYEYFMNYANHSIGISKEVGTRLNYAFTIVEPRPDILIIEYGYWQQRTKRNPFPETPAVVYTLIHNGEQIDVTLPWTFKALKTYTGVESFMDDYWTRFSNPSLSKEEAELELEKYYKEVEEAAKSWALSQKGAVPSTPVVERLVMDVIPSSINHIRKNEAKLLKEHEHHLKENLKSAGSSSFSSDLTFTLLANSSHLSFWALSDNKTMAMYLDTMEPGKGSDYYPTLIKGFSQAAKLGLTNLIIDLTNNGGGNICLGQTLLAYLQKTQYGWNDQNWGPQDLPLSVLAEQLVHAAVEYNVSDTVWSPGFYDNEEDVHIENNDTSYILPGVPHIRGGYLRNYSKLLHINDCGEYGYDLDPKDDFSPSHVIILTKGFCGSTCALFANHLALYDNVQTVVVGGVPGSAQMQYTSFPGLQVLDDKPLFGQFLELRQNITACPVDENPNDPVPRVLLTQAAFRYCIREIYPPYHKYTEAPTEYTFLPADHHLFFTDLTASYPYYIWYEILPFFPSK